MPTSTWSAPLPLFWVVTKSVQRHDKNWTWLPVSRSRSSLFHYTHPSVRVMLMPANSTLYDFASILSTTITVKLLFVLTFPIALTWRWPMLFIVWPYLLWILSIASKIINKIYEGNCPYELGFTLYPAIVGRYYILL